MYRSTLSAFLFLALLRGSHAAGQCFQRGPQHLYVGNDFNSFGTSVDLDGHVALIGASGDALSGSAFVYHHDGRTWQQGQTLRAGDGSLFDRFGASVAVDGDVIVIGAPLDDDLGHSSGSVYIFRHNGTRWVEEQKLHGIDTGERDGFGQKLALKGDLLVVGTPGVSVGSKGSGAAYVFRFDGISWVESQKLTAKDREESEAFAASIAIGDNRIICGAPTMDVDARPRDRGYAHVFRFNGSKWDEEVRLSAPSGAPADDAFGAAVAIDGETLAVGAPRVGSPVSGGAVYVFRLDDDHWTYSESLRPSDLSEFQSFGSSISLTRDALLIGSLGDMHAGRLAGSAYLYRLRDLGFEEQSKLTANAPEPLDGFGWAVAMDGDLALVGAPDGFVGWDGPVASPPSSVHAFLLPPLALDAWPELVVAGEQLAFGVCGGSSGDSVALFIEAINDVPVHNLVYLGAFGAFGDWRQDYVVPPGLAGMDVTFVAYGEVAGNEPLMSNRSLVQLR